jgi:hypothetical protein
VTGYAADEWRRIGPELHLCTVSESVAAPPPVRRTPAIEWDEFVAGHRGGLIEWNTARLGPKPGEVLREHGFRP